VEALRQEFDLQIARADAALAFGKLHRVQGCQALGDLSLRAEFFRARRDGFFG
jgi:hypothetical protein